MKSDVFSETLVNLSRQAGPHLLYWSTGYSIGSRERKKLLYRKISLRSAQFEVSELSDVKGTYFVHPSYLSCASCEGSSNRT